MTSACAFSLGQSGRGPFVTSCLPIATSIKSEGSGFFSRRRRQTRSDEVGDQHSARLGLVNQDMRGGVGTPGSPSWSAIERSLASEIGQIQIKQQVGRLKKFNITIVATVCPAVRPKKAKMSAISGGPPKSIPCGTLRVGQRTVGMPDIVQEVGESFQRGRRRDSLNPADSAGETAMMGLQETLARLVYDFCLDEHVPPDDMLRSIDRHLDLTELRQSLRPIYSRIRRQLFYLIISTIYGRSRKPATKCGLIMTAMNSAQKAPHPKLANRRGRRGRALHGFDTQREQGATSARSDDRRTTNTHERATLSGDAS
jgi:hypothetical protein